MAVLNKIRERSVFLIIIIALALFSFVLADLFRSGGFSSQKSQNTIATVNGEDVEREEFARNVENYQRNSQNNMSTTRAVEEVWNSTLSNVLVNQQIEKLGIEVGEGQINNTLKQNFAGNPNFTNEAGMFDLGVMQEYIANLQATSPQAYSQWLAMEENIVEQAKSNIYYNMVRAGVGATLVEGEEAYRLENDNVDLRFALIPYTSVEEVEVSKEEIKNYINKHKKQYEVEASTDIRYVFFEEKPSSEDEQSVRDEVENLMQDRVVYNQVSKANDSLKGFQTTSDNEAFINENSDLPYQDRFVFKSDLPQENAEQIFNLNEGETFGPYKENGYWKVSKVTDVKQVADSVKGRDILIAYQGSPVGQDITRTKEQAQQLADSLLNVLEADSDKFADLASQYSDDTSTKNNAGDLGWLTYSQLNQTSEVVQFLFNNEEGDKEVVETEAGFYILSIDEMNEKKRAVKVATLAKQLEPSEKTSNDLFAETTKFEIAAKEGDFNEEAKEASYEVRPVKGIKNMQENIPGIGNQRGIVQWTFNEDTEAGDIKRFDVPNGYVVAQVTAKTKKGLMSVEEASAKVIPIIRKEKQAEIIKNKISGTSLEEIAQNQNVQVQNASSVNLKNPTLPGATSEPKVVGAAFAMEEGEVSEPLVGKKGVYVIELVKRNEVAPLNSYRTIAEQETQTRSQQATRRLTEALKSSAEIEDNRANFY